MIIELEENIERGELIFRVMNLGYRWVPGVVNSFQHDKNII